MGSEACTVCLPFMSVRLRWALLGKHTRLTSRVCTSTLWYLYASLANSGVKVDFVDQPWNRYAKQKRYHKNNSGWFFSVLLFVFYPLSVAISREHEHCHANQQRKKQGCQCCLVAGVYFQKHFDGPWLAQRDQTLFEIFASNRDHKAAYRYRW